LNFQVEPAARLSEALARLERKGIDLVLMDLGLPDSQGLHTFHALRQAAPGIPVIVLSGNDDQELAIAAVRDGAQDYLVKGQIGGDLLVRAIRYALERERLIVELREALVHIKTLSGLLPICAGCKKIRDDKGYWSQVESYIARHSEATFTHSLCPDCMKKLYPDILPDEAES
jgi:DNA-binding response OmpR family regulator